jgi:hypothetical protein
MDWNRVQNKSAQQDSFASGVGQGAWDGGAAMAIDIADLGKAAYKAATDDAYREQVFDKASEIARATGQFGAKAVKDPIGTGESVWNQAKAAAAQAKQAFVEARAVAQKEGRLNNFYGSLLGRGGFEIGAMFVPVSKLGLLGKGAKGASAVGKAAEAGRTARQLGKAERLAKNAQKLKKKPKTKLGHAQGCEAKLVKPPRKIGRREVEEWYRSQHEYFRNPKNLDNHMQGTDFRKPVTKHTLPANAELIQYVRADGKPGMYFTRPGTPMDLLGIHEPPRRIMRRFVVKEPIEIIESTAAEMPKGLAPGVGGSGGGQQLIFPNGWDKSVQLKGGGH